MKIVGWILGVGAGLFVLMLIIGANVSPEKARAYAAQDQADTMCDKMMSDAALGAERRMTREMCDRLKDEMAKRVRLAGSSKTELPMTSAALPLSPSDQERSICANNIEAIKSDYKQHMNKYEFKAAAESMRRCAKLLQDPFLGNMVIVAEQKAKGK